jgi:hypothetical protein
MRTPKAPPGARHLRTYAEFASYLADFAADRYPLLWASGRPGAGKTELIKSALRGRRAYYRNGGQLTPAQFFIDCYGHRGRPIVLDDAEHLLENKVGVKLISSLGDTGAVKTLCFGTTSRALGGAPPTFNTTSPLCIIANRTTQHEEIQSRAVTLFFDPTNLEVHRAVAGWFWDQEIHDWFGRHLTRLPPLDTRWYVIADRDKRAKRDWRRIILDAHAPNKGAIIVQDLETDPAYPTREDKAHRFIELMAHAKGGSRASYFRLRALVEEAGRLAVDVVPPIPLRRTKPPAVPSALELESMEAGLPEGPEEEAQPVDVPGREEFARPVAGHAPSQAPPPRPALDDSLPWERPPRQGEGDQE